MNGQPDTSADAPASISDANESGMSAIPSEGRLLSPGTGRAPP
jgi:hypothetical protein